MSDDVVLISTHDLARAGVLREAFQRVGYGTDLVTPKEELSGEEAALLVLTGGLEEGGTGDLARQAREELQIPVFAIAQGESLPPALRPGFDEVFTSTTTAADVAAVGRTAIERRRLQRITGILGNTDAMREVLERVVQIAPVVATVLVTGESGTGKELVARGLHGLSPRRHKPFIAVNVAALSETLLESELFGHEKGAFTGAIDSRRGLFELADGGTIFLDEIGEMPL
ncbi:MAG: sigma-54 factor interaction domain-containing protein, partial [Gemmatimonadota bacterium]